MEEEIKIEKLTLEESENLIGGLNSASHGFSPGGTSGDANVDV